MAEWAGNERSPTPPIAHACILDHQLIMAADEIRSSRANHECHQA